MRPVAQIAYGTCVLIFWVTCTPAGAQPLQSPGDALRVAVQPAPDATTPFELAITNTSAKAVTAYRIQLNVPADKYNSGDFIEDLVPSIPSVGRSAPGRYVHNGPLLPGHTRLFPYTPPKGSSTGFLVVYPTLICVVFADNTAIGDRDFIEAIFDERRGIHDGLQSALAILKQTQPTYKALLSTRANLLDKARLQQSATRFDQSVSVGIIMASRCVREVLERHDAEQQDFGPALSHCIATITSQLNAYTENLQKKEPSK